MKIALILAFVLLVPVLAADADKHEGPWRKVGPA